MERLAASNGWPSTERQGSTNSIPVATLAYKIQNGVDNKSDRSLCFTVDFTTLQSWCTKSMIYPCRSLHPRPNVTSSHTRTRTHTNVKSAKTLPITTRNVKISSVAFAKALWNITYDSGCSEVRRRPILRTHNAPVLVLKFAALCLSSDTENAWHTANKIANLDFIETLIFVPLGDDMFFQQQLMIVHSRSLSQRPTLQKPAQDPQRSRFYRPRMRLGYSSMALRVRSAGLSMFALTRLFCNSVNVRVNRRGFALVAAAHSGIVIFTLACRLQYRYFHTSSCFASFL